jgi:glycosyltransferase involved in cell wall biosynthesis
METDTVEVNTDLICIGTLEPRKNQRYALDIVAASVRIGRPLSLTLVGDGPDRMMLESLAQELGIRQQVSFAGFMRNAADLIQTHAGCLHVARLENLPLALIEALSRSVPVFAPAVGGVPEVFADGNEGRFYSSGRRRNCRPYNHRVAGFAADNGEGQACCPKQISFRTLKPGRLPPV